MLNENSGLAWNTDPETSHHAAESIDAGRLFLEIYQVMSEFGHEGCTAEQVKDRLPNVGLNAITPRFKQMIDLGMIQCTGETVLARSGRKQEKRRVLPAPFSEPDKKQSKIQRLESRIKNLEELLRLNGIKE